jgi:hypothetical protein
MYEYKQSFVSMRFIIIITQFRVRIATNLSRDSILHECKLGATKQSFISVYRVYSVSTDNIVT